MEKNKQCKVHDKNDKIWCWTHNGGGCMKSDARKKCRDSGGYGRKNCSNGNKVITKSLRISSKKNVEYFQSEIWILF